MSNDIQTGRMVQDLRISRNLTQEDVAARAGVSRATVSRLERGLIDGITVGKLRAISRALGMPSIASLGWRSPELERLRNRLHASMVTNAPIARVAAAAGTRRAPGARPPTTAGPAVAARRLESRRRGRRAGAQPR